MSGINKLGRHLDHAHVTHSQQTHTRDVPKQAPKAHDNAQPHKPSGAVRNSPSANVAAREGVDASLRKAMLQAMQQSSARASAPISTPARRHDGSNKYDRKPITDRLPGDPDRYRSVNPNVVSRDGKRYFFPAQVKHGAHYFDKDHKMRGLVPGSDVKVDITRIKMMRGADGKERRYVRAEGLGYVRLGALTSSLKELKKELKEGPAFRFPLTPGAQLYDSFGKTRGVIGAGDVQLNVLPPVEMNGEKYYYAFSTRLADGTHASGLVRAADLLAQPYPLKTEEVRRLEPAHDQGPFDTSYFITGGNPQAVGQDGKLKFGYYVEVGGRQEFVSYKVLPGVSLAENKNIAATDYLRRSDGVVNMGYNVVGLSSDTFKVDGDMRLVFHHNSKDKEATVRVPLYHPEDADHAGKKPVGYMTFAYGYVNTPGGRRWGWMAVDAMTKLSPTRS